MEVLFTWMVRNHTNVATSNKDIDSSPSNVSYFRPCMSIVPNNQVSHIYKDAGGNQATGSNCPGLFHIGNTISCIPFLTSGPHTSPVAAPTKAPTRPATPSPTTVASTNITYVPPLDPDTNALPLVSRSEPVGYFNFNTQDPKFGPSGWANVNVKNNPYSMYANLAWDTSVNQCGTGDSGGAFQSPIDLFITTSLCLEVHQIRAHSGDWKNLTAEGEVRFDVTPTRLRLQIIGNGTAHPIIDASHGYDPLFANHIEVTVSWCFVWKFCLRNQTLS